MLKRIIVIYGFHAGVLIVIHSQVVTDTIPSKDGIHEALSIIGRLQTGSSTGNFIPNPYRFIFYQFWIETHFTDAIPFQG